MIVAVEEVWNKFLLSPLEFARYVDELDSPWLKAYFDVGNIVFYGYPQDWIRTLGARIAKVHLKDFHLDRPNGRFQRTILKRRSRRPGDLRFSCCWCAARDLNPEPAD